MPGNYTLATRGWLSKHASKHLDVFQKAFAAFYLAAMTKEPAWLHIQKKL